MLVVDIKMGFGMLVLIEAWEKGLNTISGFR